MAARILVVDDNRTNLELMLYLLRAFGYSCDAASDAPAGLAALRATAYDLALVDILMPGMDGFAFARSCKSDPKVADVPLVAVTALAMPGDRERMAKAGFDGSITKPIDPERFVGEVETYLRDVRPGEMKPHPPASPTESRIQMAGPIVLAVDDLQTNLDVIRASLAPFGYTVAEARSVREALDLLERTRPAIIICDLHMPDEGGFALIERIREHESWRDIPFVFLSSTAWQTKDRRRGLELGARKFILRPIDPRQLRTEIDELIEDGDDSRR